MNKDNNSPNKPDILRYYPELLLNNKSVWLFENHPSGYLKIILSGYLKIILSGY